MRSRDRLEPIRCIKGISLRAVLRDCSPRLASPRPKRSNRRSRVLSSFNHARTYAIPSNFLHTKITETDAGSTRSVIRSNIINNAMTQPSFGHAFRPKRSTHRSRFRPCRPAVREWRAKSHRVSTRLTGKRRSPFFVVGIVVE